jgi:hypothetical protein
MANLQKRLGVTELDFDEIKSNLITYFKSTEPFKDYDYSGSGLNQLLDVLAYNTHYNAMLAHTAVNESFIDTAQLRSSVVSNAKLLGYLPHSASAPTVNINIAFIKADNSNSIPSNITLPKGSNFKTTYEDNKYIYTTLDDHVLTLNGTNNRYEKNNIELKQGSFQTKRFNVVNSDSKTTYQINDDNIDLNTLIVRVYDNINSAKFEVYTNFTSLDLTKVNNVSEDPLYFISENAYGKYELSFSTTGIFGKKPPNLGVVEIEYLTTDGPESNGANVFIYESSSPSSVLPRPIITTLNKSFGGNFKESIDSVRLNAPISFVSQNRAVTANDYKSLIYSNFPEAKSITVWGGEDNIPPQYGNVYISIQPQTELGEDNLSDDSKRNILEYLKSKKILSISPIIIDPQKVSLVLDVLFKYNSNLSILSKNQLENKVSDVVAQFNTDYLDSFEKVFRHSTLLRIIDTCDPSILNSLIRVFVSKKFTVKAESRNANDQIISSDRIVLDFGTSLTPDDGSTIAYIDGWFYNGNKIYLGDEPSNISNIRNVFKYTLNNGVVSKFKDSLGRDVPPIGSIDLNTGIMTIDDLIADDDTVVRIDMVTVSNDIAPKRNQLLSIDLDNLNVTADVDTIAIGGSSRTIDYKPFSRDR